FISMISCTSFPLSTPVASSTRRNRPVYNPVRGWGIFNRLYGDFCTGADTRFAQGRPEELLAGLITSGRLYFTVTYLKKSAARSLAKSSLIRDLQGAIISRTSPADCSDASPRGGRGKVCGKRALQGSRVLLGREPGCNPVYGGRA